MLREATTVLFVVTAFAMSGTTASVLLGADAPGAANSAVEQLAQQTEISFTRQSSDGMTVVVDRVRLRRGGFVAIHDTTAEPPDPDLVGSVLGVSRFLDTGVHRNVTITLSKPVNVSETDGSVRVIAMPHRDTNANRVFDFVIGNGTVDTTYERGGTPITDPATLDLSSRPLPPEASISFRNQSLRGSLVTVRSVTLSDGGFVAILGEGGDVIGVSEYIEAETQSNVRIRLVRRPEEPANLTARAHLDTNGDRVFGFDISGGAVDRPYGSNATDTARVERRDSGTSTPTVTRTPTRTATSTASETVRWTRTSVRTGVR